MYSSVFLIFVLHCVCIVFCCIVPSLSPLSNLSLLVQHFFHIINNWALIQIHHAYATYVAAVAAGNPPVVVVHAPASALQPAVVAALNLFQAQMPIIAPGPTANLLAASRQYFQSLSHFAHAGILANPDNSLQRLPVDTIFANAYSDVGSRFEVLHGVAFGAHRSPAIEIIMRQTALADFTNSVNQFTQGLQIPSVLMAAQFTDAQLIIVQSRMLVLGPQGMGKVSA